MSDTFDLRPIEGTPDEVEKVRATFAQAAAAFRPVAVVAVLAATVGTLLVAAQGQWWSMGMALIVVPLILAAHRLRRRAMVLRRFEKLFTVSPKGLQARVSFDGERPVRLGTYLWKDVQEVREEDGAVVLRFDGGDEQRLGDDAFPTPAHFEELVARARSGR